MESPTKIYAAVLALTAFAVSTVSGLANGAAAADILWHSIFSMLACYPVGMVLGMIAGHAVDEYSEAYRKQHPVPEIPAYDVGGGEVVEVDIL